MSRPITIADVLGLINRFLSDRGPRLAASAEDRLSDLGVDSLTAINILLTAAEEFGLDLTRLDPTASVPNFVGELMALMQRLHAQNSP